MKHSADVPRLAIACQGGGAHTAFTAGVLAYLFLAFETFRRAGTLDRRFQLKGMSGTSGGAITAAMAWSDPGHGGWAEGAFRALRYWNLNKASLGPAGKPPWWWNEYFVNAQAQWAATWQDWIPRVEFPTSPILSALIRDRMRADMRTALGLSGSATAFGGRAEIELFVGAVDILNLGGEPDTAFQTFPRSKAREIQLDELLASACVPELFEPQALPAPGQDGQQDKQQFFWDGLYSQNPPLTNFFAGRAREHKPDLIWIVQINPSSYEGRRAPATPRQVDDRRNELAGNLSLGQELRSIDRFNAVASDLAALQESGPVKLGAALQRLKPVTVAFVKLGTHAGSGRPLANYELDHDSKFNRDPAFIDALIAEGIAMAFEAARTGRLVRPDDCQDKPLPPTYQNPDDWPAPAELLPLFGEDAALSRQWARLTAAI